MASLAAKFISKRVLKESATNKFGREDPYFETIPATDFNGRPDKHGKTKKVKRRINPHIPQADAEVLTKVKRRAYRLDNAINICGIRFGWSSVIGIVPAIGDFIDVFMALMVMNTAMKVSPGKDREKLRAVMVSNIIMDFVVGLVPFLGDVADALFKANTRNAVALEAMLNKRVKALEEKRGAPHDDNDRHSRVYLEDSSPPSYDDVSTARHEHSRNEIQRPAKSKSTTHGKGGWFGGRGDRDADLERGEAGAPPKPPRK